MVFHQFSTTALKKDVVDHYFVQRGLQTVSTQTTAQQNISYCESSRLYQTIFTTSFDNRSITFIRRTGVDHDRQHSNP